MRSYLAQRYSFCCLCAPPMAGSPDHRRRNKALSRKTASPPRESSKLFCPVVQAATVWTEEAANERRTSRKNQKRNSFPMLDSSTLLRMVFLELECLPFTLWRVPTSKQS